MKKLPDKCIDLIIADPPYNIRIDKWDKINNYLEWCKKWIAEGFRILKPNGSFYIWGTTKNNDFLRLKLWIDETFNEYEFKNFITVCRNPMLRKNPTDRYLDEHENLLFYAGKNNTFNAQRDKPTEEGMKRWGKVMDENYYVSWDKLTPSMKRVRKSGFYIGSLAKSWWLDNGNNGGNKKKVFHTTTKSEFVCNRIVKVSSNENDLVYIPFAGSGSEIMSCIKNNRNWIATEINKEYIENIIIPRLKKEGFEININ